MKYHHTHPHLAEQVSLAVGGRQIGCLRVLAALGRDRFVVVFAVEPLQEHVRQADEDFTVLLGWVAVTYPILTVPPEEGEPAYGEGEDAGDDQCLHHEG